jgi:hypothetical protein
MHGRRLLLLAVVGCSAALATVEQRSGLAATPGPEAASRPDGPDANRLSAARDKGLAWLAQNQAKDGSWGNEYTVAVTALACLAHLSASDEPFTGECGKSLMRGLEFLLAQQKAGEFPKQGHTWIHGQGFATLALAEAYGRGLLCKSKPDWDANRVRGVVAAAAKVIADNQSDSGGWWYVQGSKGQHEGSTTVTAVQALVAAANFGVEINEDVLDKGFEYLKKCQNKDGGFDYQLDNSPDTVSMKEGTAADVATLALMKKFDHSVMMNAFEFLVKVTPGGISKERFPYYGHFYGCMGMKLLGEEMRPLREKTAAYVAAAQTDVLAWQEKDGSWPVLRWVKENSKETATYSTAFASLLLSVPEARLSIFNRTPTKLPKAP